MYTSIELLDMVKARYRLPSDYAAAKKIGVSKACISAVRNNIRTIDLNNCLKIAELLELDPLKVIASAQVERGQRTHNEKAINLWSDYAA